MRHFLTGPVGCEITATQLTPDMRTMFVNIQHPGEAPLPHPGRNDPSKPKAISSWPDGKERCTATLGNDCNLPGRWWRCEHIVRVE